MGSAAGTTRGLTEEEFYTVGKSIAGVVLNKNDEAKLAEIKETISQIIAAHPLYPEFN